MKSWEIEKMVRKEGYYEGQNKVNLLNVKLNEAGRLEDIIRAAGDKKYQESLFEEFGL